MNVLKLAWKNIVFRPLQSSLSVLLLALGVGLVVILLLLQKQLNQNFDRNLAGVDLILGAKGSPLQMVMSSMYQLDAPTGNLTIDEVKAFLNPRHPLIEEAVPLSMGDNFRGFRIVGATPNLIDWYGGELAEGELYMHDGQAVMGAEVAMFAKMRIGDEFTGDHGLMEDDPLHEEHAHGFTLTGILKPTGTVLDRLVLVTNQAYWAMHGEHDHGEHGGHGEHEDHGEHEEHEEHGEHEEHEGHGDHLDHEEHGEHSGHGEHEDHLEHGEHSEHGEAPEVLRGVEREGAPRRSRREDRGSGNLAASEGLVSVQGDGEAPEVLRGVEREGAPRRSRREEGHDHHAHEMQPTSGSPNHDHDHHDHGSHDHHDHDHHGPTQVQTAADLLEEDLSQELTSVLIRYKNDKDFQSLQMGRMINENTDIMAVDPAYQISKVRYQFGQGERVLRILAIVIMIVSALSVFISLFNSLRERRYELALMRGMGAGRNSIFGLIIAEGLLLGLLGFVVGIALGHGLMEVLSTRLEDNYGFRFAGFQWLNQEWWLLLGALGVGLVAAILPAAQAAETDIAETLT